MCANRTKPIICIGSAPLVLNKQPHLRRRYKYRCAVSQQRQADERALFAGITRTEFMSPIRHFPIYIPVRSVPAALRLLPRPPVLEAVHTQAPSSKKKSYKSHVSSFNCAWSGSNWQHTGYHYVHATTGIVTPALFSAPGWSHSSVSHPGLLTSGTEPLGPIQ